MKKIILIFAFISCLKLFGQNEDKIWYFGPFGAGLDFTTCNPVVKTNGNTSSNAAEGVVSICDRTTGRLLFYCTEAKIIDSTFNVMPNGLNVGNGTSGTQSTIIRKPGSNTIFYYFVTDIQGGAASSFTPTAKGISYCVIDMTLNSNKGDVVSSHNPIKDTSNCEKLTAIKHSNGTDVWLLAHEYRTNNFLVYSITSSGINLTPQVFSVGPVINTFPSKTYSSSKFDAIGELKASPDGNKIAFSTLYNGITCLLDFNKSTGAISNPINLNLSGFGGYGVSFSPDNKKVYFSCVDTTNFSQAVNSQIVQFDISSNNALIIQGSKQIINSCSSCSYRSLKLGPDGKIYCAKIGSGTEAQYLGVINSPNNIGAAANYNHTGVYLNGTIGSWGLNNLMETNNFCNAAGIEEINNVLNSKIIFDNSTGILSIDNQNKNSNIKLFDVTGKLIQEHNLDIGVNKIDIKEFPTGVYIISVSINHDPVRKLKVVKY